MNDAHWTCPLGCEERHDDTKPTPGGIATAYLSCRAHNLPMRFVSLEELEKAWALVGQALARRGTR